MKDAGGGSVAVERYAEGARGLDQQQRAQGGEVSAVVEAAQAAMECGDESGGELGKVLDGLAGFARQCFDEFVALDAEGHQAVDQESVGSQERVEQPRPALN